MHCARSGLLAALALSIASLTSSAIADDGPQEKDGERDARSLFDFTVQDIDGKAVRLKRFQDQVLMVVNVASQ